MSAGSGVRRVKHSAWKCTDGILSRGGGMAPPSGHCSPPCYGLSPCEKAAIAAKAARVRHCTTPVAAFFCLFAFCLQQATYPKPTNSRARGSSCKLPSFRRRRRRGKGGGNATSHLLLHLRAWGAEGGGMVWEALCSSSHKLSAAVSGSNPPRRMCCKCALHESCRQLRRGQGRGGDGCQWAGLSRGLPSHSIHPQ